MDRDLCSKNLLKCNIKDSYKPGAKYAKTTRRETFMISMGVDSNTFVVRKSLGRSVWLCDYHVIMHTYHLSRSFRVPVWGQRFAFPSLSQAITCATRRRISTLAIRAKFGTYTRYDVFIWSVFMPGTYIATLLQETSILRFKKQIFQRKLKFAFCISEF